MSDVAQEVVKAAAFVTYVERHAPGLGSITGFSSRLTDALKNQAEKNDGVSPFSAVYDQVKGESPGVATEGFGYAKGFVEYVGKEAPGVFNLVKDGAGDVLGVIKNAAPQVFAGAEVFGASVGKFFSDQGPEFIETMRSQGGSVISFLTNNHNEVFSTAMQGASAAKSAISAAVSSLDMGDLQNAAKFVGSGIASVTHQIDGDVLSALSTAGGAIVGALDAEFIADATNGVMSAVGTVAAALPFLLPLQIALKDIGNAVQQATYNKESAKMLQDRCTDCGKLIQEMGPKITKICKTEDAQKEMVQPFVDAVKECTEFLTTFSNRGFLSHMFRWKREGRSLAMLDKKVSDTLQNLSMRVDGQQIDLQVANAEKLDEVFNLLKTASAGASEPAQMDPELLAEVVRKAGAESVGQISDELQSVGFKLDQIEKTLSSMAAKLDVVAGKIDQLAADQKDRDAELKNLIIYGQAEARKTAEQLTLAAMKLAAESGGQLVNEKFASNIQLEYMAKRCRELRAKVPTVVVIHPRGIGTGSFVTCDGEPGPNGPNGQSFPNGHNGQRGSAPGADGDDGMDGEDGHDGQEGDDGTNGESAVDFEVMIEFVSEDTHKGTRKYRVEHAGANGKDEHEIEVSLLNSMILIDGKGGVGGRGGSGGDGGNGSDGGCGGDGAPGRADVDGGNGGNGGHGGNGGVGGLAGNGGNGANGCKVVIHTNDPSVLALVEVDVSNGEGGAPGTHGRPGQAGNGGAGGQGGPGDSYVEGRGEHSYTRNGKPGRKGKAGKKGKNGRPAPTKQSKAGASGSHGAVSLCVYDKTGMCESGGTPFRVLFNKKDLPRLFPQPINFGIVSATPQDVVLYGQQLRFGPVLPINVGSLSAPPSELLCFLMIHGKNMISTLATAPFPRIAAENKTRYGELPPNAAQTVVLAVPKLKNTGFHLEPNAWPLPAQWSPSTQCTAKFRAMLKVDGIMQKYSSCDGDNVSSKEFDVTCDIPVQIVPDQSGTGVLAPRSVLVAKNTVFHVQFAVRNRLAHAALDPQLCGIALLTAGQGFAAKVTRPEAETTLVTTSPGVTPDGFQRLRSQCPAPAVPPGQVQPVAFVVALPEAGAVPGSSLLVRSELFFESELVQHTPCRPIRLCAPWPPETPASTSDVLILVDQTFSPDDFQALRSVALTLGFTACFLDYQHFAEMNGGRLPASVWAPHKGKATVLWMPSLPGLVPLVPQEDLAEHLRAGGALVCGGQATFTLPPDLAKLNTQVFRRVVKAGTMSMADIRRGMVINDKCLAGAGLVQLTLALVAVMTTEQKLSTILQKGEALGRLALGELQVTDYQSTLAVGGGCCCFGGSKPAQIVPINKTSFTLRDAWLSALRTDLSIDRALFFKDGNTKLCVAVEALQAFAGKHLLALGTKTRAVGLAARDACAAVYAADLLADVEIAGGTKVIWMGVVAQLKLTLLRCESVAAEFQGDAKAMAERAKEVDIITTVRARPGGGSVLATTLAHFVALN